MNRYYASDWEQSSQSGLVAHLTGCGCGSGCGTCGTGCSSGCGNGCITSCGCSTGCGCNNGCNNGCGCDSGCPGLPPVPPCSGPGPFPPCPGTGPTGPTGAYNKVQLLPKNNTGDIVPVKAYLLYHAAPKVAALFRAKRGV